jgi:hypothetical protein
MTITLRQSQLASFTRTYHEARAIYLDLDSDYGHAPMNPVVRLEDRGDIEGVVWRIDSDLHSAEDTLLECPLDVFDGFFCEVYEDDDYNPSLEDMRDFADMLDN